MRGAARISLVVGLLGVGVFASPAAGRQTESTTPDAGNVQVVEETELDRQVRALASELRCPVCQGLSLQDSPSELAQEMREVIRSRLAAGETPDEVRAYFESGYGEWILMEPKAEGFNLAVYLLPLAALIAGGAFLVVVIRRWTSAARKEQPADETIDEADPDLAAWDDLVRH